MLENTDEVFKSLGDDLEQSRLVHSLYVGLVDSMSCVIVMLQRALNVNNDDQRIDALDQSTKVLKNVARAKKIIAISARHINENC